MARVPSADGEVLDTLPNLLLHSSYFVAYRTKMGVEWIHGQEFRVWLAFEVSNAYPCLYEKAR